MDRKAAMASLCNANPSSVRPMVVRHQPRWQAPWAPQKGCLCSAQSAVTSCARGSRIFGSVPSMKSHTRLVWRTRMSEFACPRPRASVTSSITPGKRLINVSKRH